jgi:hypothetical protein
MKCSKLDWQVVKTRGDLDIRWHFSFSRFQCEIRRTKHKKFRANVYTGWSSYENQEGFPSYHDTLAEAARAVEMFVAKEAL